MLRLVMLVRGDPRADQTRVPQIVERPAELVVPGLGRVVVLEPGHRIQRRDRAAVVRGDTIMRVADEEGKVELRQERPRHHGRVAGFRLRRVRVRRCLRLLRLLCTYAALDPVQGWRDAGGLAVRRKEVVDYVLDEDAFALFFGVSILPGLWNCECVDVSGHMVVGWGREKTLGQKEQA